MQKNGKLPHTTTAVLEHPATTPELRAVTPELWAATPEQRATTPELQASTPELWAATPEVQASTPELWAATPELRAATPEVQASTPELWAATPELRAAETPASARASKRRRTIYVAKSSIEQRLMAAKVAIEAGLNDPMLQEVLTPYGYPLAEIRQGQALRTQALALVQQQHARAGKQIAATDARAKVQAQLHATYTRHVAFARLAFRSDRDAAKALDLSARKSTLDGWVLQAEQFYTNALADQAIIAKLARYSVTKSQLQEAQAQVEAVASGIVAQQSSKASTQASKQMRDAALRALDRWMLEFIAVARIALADQPQRLAQLGLARG